MEVVRVDSLQIEELELYAGASENELYRYNEPELGFFIAESPNVIERALLAGYEPISFLMEERYLGDVQGMLEKTGVVAPVYIAENSVLQQITGFPMTRGMLSLMRRRSLPSLEEICAGKNRIVVMDDVENPTNVGAIFRSAAALYMDGVILANGCSDPLYRRASRVSMGTVFQIPWTVYEKENVNYQDKLRELGYKTVAMALKEDSVRLDDARLNAEGKLAIIMGSEGYGLPDEVISKCDYTVMIPMSHEVDSLNVAAASAVAFYQLSK